MNRTAKSLFKSTHIRVGYDNSSIKLRQLMDGLDVLFNAFTIDYVPIDDFQPSVLLDTGYWSGANGYVQNGTIDMLSSGR